MQVATTKKSWWEKPAWVLACFILMAILIRWPSFFRSVINHDESTYVVIADALLKGKVYWIDIFDTKPIGIFWIYSFLGSLFGGSIWGYRLGGTIALALTSFFLYLLKRDMGSTAKAGLAAGMLYLLVNSIFKFIGISPNTEIYFNLSTAIAFFVLWRFRNPFIAILAGLIMGLGFLVKYVVLFDAVAMGLFMLWLIWKKERKPLPTVLMLAAFGLGMLTPLLLTWGWYIQHGIGEVFYFHTFELSGRYIEGAPSLWDYLRSFADYNLRFLPATLMVLIVLSSTRTDQRVRVLGGIWLTFVAIVVLLPGKFFYHYYIHYSLPFCFLAGEFFGLKKEVVPRWIRWLRNERVALSLAVLLPLVNLFFMKQDYIDKPDGPRLVQQEISKRYQKGDGIYTGNTSWQILYHLMDEDPPIAYPHGSLIWMENHSYALGIDFEKEIEKIQAAAPRFILMSHEKETRPTVFWAFLEKDYTQIPIPGLDESRWEKVYERKAEATPAE